MIVLMMALVNKTISRYSYLLIFNVIISCYSNNKEDKSDYIDNELYSQDSINISIKKIPPNSKVAINYVTADFKSIVLDFKNGTEEIKDVSKKVPFDGLANIILSYRAFTIVDNKHKSFWYLFSVDNLNKNIEFVFNQGDLILESSDTKILMFQEIKKQFSLINNSFLNKKINETDFLKKIKDLKNRLLTNEINNNEHAKSFISIEYYNSKAMVINLNFEQVSEIIKNTSYSTTTLELFDKIISKNWSKINLTKYEQKDSIFIKGLVKNTLNYISNKKIKNDPYLNLNLEWIKKTPFFSLYSDDFDLIIKKLNTKSISNILDFEIYYKDKSIKKLNQIISKSDKNFFLIDFWASWCAPCISNIKRIKELNLPEDIEVIYISLDKTREKQEWQLKENELNLVNSYLFVENENNKRIINENYINQIPRYFLITKDLKILNENLITPQEGDFKKVIEDLIKK